MEFSRRKFMFAASAVAAGSAVPQAVRALEVLEENQNRGRLKIDVGYAAITWGDNLAQALNTSPRLAIEASNSGQMQ